MASKKTREAWKTYEKSGKGEDRDKYMKLRETDRIHERDIIRDIIREAKCWGEDTSGMETHYEDKYGKKFYDRKDKSYLA